MFKIVYEKSKKKMSLAKIMLLQAVILVIAIDFALMCVVGSARGTYARMLMDMPSILLLILVVVPALVFSGNGKDFLRVFAVGRKEFSIRELKRSAEAVRLTQRLVLCATGIDMVIALIVLLYNLDSCDWLCFGPALSVAFLGILYAAIIEFFLAIMSANIQNVITDLMDVEDENEEE